MTRNDLLGLVQDAVSEQTADTTNGLPAGDVLEAGCRAHGYCDPEDAANEFRTAIAEKAIEVVLTQLYYANEIPVSTLSSLTVG